MTGDTREAFYIPKQREWAKDPLPFFLFSLSVLILTLLTSTYPMPLFIAVFFLAWVIGKRTSLMTVAKRLAAPLAIALVLLLTQSLFYGHEVMASLDLGLMRVSLYREGLRRGLFLLSKVIAGSLVLVNISVNLSIPDFIRCLSFLKVPEILILESLLTYRYIYLLREEAQRIHQAQRLRGGHVTWRKGIRSASLLGSSLVIRSLSRMGRVHEAARLRLGSGHGLPAIPWTVEKRVDPREVFLLVLAFLMFLLSWRVFHVNH